MSSTTSNPTTEAARFVQALRSNDSLYQDYNDEFVVNGDVPPTAAALNEFFQKQGYQTTLSDVNAALASVSANDLSYWQGDYNTQLIDEGTPGPRILIQGGSITISGITINNYTFQQSTLTWSDSTNGNNGRLNFVSLVGLGSQLDPASDQDNKNASDDLVANPYIGPQFQGFFWAKGHNQPSDANLMGRMGKFPDPSSSTSASAAQTSQGPTQASSLPQWAGKYNIYTVDQTQQGPNIGIQLSTDTLTIDSSGNVSFSGVTIIQPTFNNDTLEWNSAAGNSSNAILKMRDDTIAGSDPDSPYTGDQFGGCFWTSGDQQPADFNWYGYVNGPSASSSGDTTGDQTDSGSDAGLTAPQTPQGAIQDMNGWSALVTLGNEAMNMYMQQQLGEAVIHALPYVWKALKFLFKGVSSLIQKFRNIAPKPTPAETEPSGADKPANGDAPKGEEGQASGNVNDSSGGSDANNAAENPGSAPNGKSIVVESGNPNQLGSKTVVVENPKPTTGPTNPNSQAGEPGERGGAGERGARVGEADSTLGKVLGDVEGVLGDIAKVAVFA
ncbi:hypothetical protein CGLO_09001 [Colletotrichum gloeosporioides Cg-14]|uniref:Uncharacterized protein n=1 Tax=Colletotrichum gloeosporioides (strain Cg-14) TaxID=1237896 RepID=T0KES9_COLGC|nr:hypothetical protein CGLO_09001 [Colletotrichum gloeosporioides Cg-14]